MVAVEACGLLEVHQLLCGRDIAREHRHGNVVHRFAAQMANYVYVIADPRDRTCAVVDPAWDTQGIVEYCREKGWDVRAALFTHRHFDHTGGRVPRAMTGASQDIELPGVRDFQAAGVKCFVGRRDAKTIAAQAGIEETSLVAVANDDMISLNENVSIQVLETPGHTPGSVCFLLGPDSSRDAGILFTGDTLFIGSCGRVDLPESNVSEMLQSLSRLSALPVNTMVLPGHNYAMDAHSTIGGEIETNGMMIQAMRRFNASRAQGVRGEPVSAYLPLPDYLGVARDIFASFETRHPGPSVHGCLCSDDAEDDRAQPPSVVSHPKLSSHV